MMSGSAAGLQVVLTTTPDVASAERIGRALVEERLIACANLVPGLTSIYRWEGEVRAEGEVMLLMKTTADRLAQLERRLPELHPYDVPELVALPVSGALEAYGGWVMSETAQEQR